MGHEWALLDVFVAAAAFDADCLAMVFYRSPFCAGATGFLSVYRPKLLGFCRRYRRVVFRFRRIPDCINYEAGPQGGRD